MSAIEKFNNEIQSGSDAQKALEVASKGANKATRELMESANGGIVSQKDLGLAMNKSTLAAKAGTVAVKAFSIALNMIAMVAIAKGIELVVKSIDDYIHRLEKAADATRDAIEKNNDLKASISSINDELDKTKSRIDELEKKDNLTFIEQDELQNLKDTTTELERQLEVKQALQNVSSKEARDKAIDYIEQNQSYLRRTQTDEFGYSVYQNFNGNQIDVTKQRLLDYDELLSKQKALQKEMDNFKIQNPSDFEYIPEYNYLSTEYEALSNDISALNKDISESVETLGEFKSSLNEVDDQNFISSITEIQDAFSELFGGSDKSATQSFDKIWDSESFKRSKEELKALAHAGKLDATVLKSNESYKRLIDATGRSAEETAENIYALAAVEKAQNNVAVSGISSYKETIQALDDMNDAFSALDEVYAKFIVQDENIGFEDLVKLNEEFGDVSGISDYIKAIHKAQGNTEETQEAFDNLLSAYIDQTGILDKVNEGNYQLIESYLKEMGVANADSLVQEALAHNISMVAAEKYYAANASYNLANASEEEKAAFINEAESAGISRAAIIELMMAKISCNANSIVTDGDIQNLMDLATAAGIAEAAVKNAKAAQTQKISSGSGIVRNPGADAAINASIANGLKKGVNAELYKPKEYTFTGGTKSNSARGGGGGSSGGGGGSGSKKEPTQLNWIEIRLKRIDEYVDKLKKKIDEAFSYRSKNTTTDTVIDSMNEKLLTYTQAFNKYMEKANSLGLSPIYIDKIQNGTIELEEITDESIQTVIDDYTKWYDKAIDVQKQIDETKESIHELNVQKLDNIINDFGALNSLLEKYGNYRQKLLDLSKKHGDEIYKSDYEDLISDQNGLYENLEDEYTQLENQLKKLISSGDIKKYSEDWYKYQEELADIQGQMLDCTDAVEDFKDSIIELRFKPIEDLSQLIEHINSEFSVMSNLIGSDGLVKNGMLTDKGLTQVALYGKQLSNAKMQTAEYKEAIKAVIETYNNGDITLDEYNERIREYQKAQWDATAATKESRDAILNLYYTAIQQEIDAFSELTQKRKDDLAAQREMDDYQKKITDKQKAINTLQSKIRMLSNSTARSDQALKLQLEKELTKARQELEDTQSEHEYSKRVEVLDKENEAYAEAKNSEIEELKNDLVKQDAVIENYLGKVKDNYRIVYTQLTEYGETFNMDMTENLSEPWSSAELATQTFKEAVTDAISQINYDISRIDTSGLNNLVGLMSEFSNLGSGGSGSNGADWMDNYSNTTTGTWKKESSGWWYENADGSYTTDDFQKINGKLYSFDSRGYMQSEWQQADNGDWLYFDSNEGHGEAVKSTWIQGKTKDDWYYIGNNGIMVTDAYIKDKNGDGYYFVNREGLWDGKLEYHPDTKKYPIAYKNGTYSAKPGLALVDEEGYNSEVQLTRDGLLRNMAGGETIFNKKQKDFLYSLSNDPAQYIGDVLAKYTLPNIPDWTGVSVHINGNMVNIEGSADEKTIQAAQKMIRKELADLPRKIMIDNRKF